MILHLVLGMYGVTLHSTFAVAISLLEFPVNFFHCQAESLDYMYTFEALCVLGELKKALCVLVDLKMYIDNYMHLLIIIAAKKSNQKSFQNLPNWFPNRSTRLSERVLGVSWEVSGRVWGPGWLQDGFKVPKVKVLTPCWRPSWRPKSIKNRF